MQSKTKYNTPFQMNRIFTLIILLIFSTSVFAQNKPYKISGTVFEDGNPIKGIKLEVLNNNGNHTFTDEEGKFILDVSEPKVSLMLIENDFVRKTVEVLFSENENRLTYVDIILNPTENLDEILVTDNPSMVTNSRAALQREINNVPGGAYLEDLSSLKIHRSQTLKDAIGKVPGVIIQDFFGGNDQPRLNIRGSGLQSNPQARGITLLQDGIPINLADGSYIIGLLEPQAAHLVQIYKGSNALRYGSSTLGGAVNMVTRNGYNASPLAVKLEGGSFGYFNGSLSTGQTFGKNDVFAAVSYNQSDGFRVYNDSERLNLMINAGRRFSENFESRLLVNYTDLSFDVAGPLTYGQIMDDPKQINTTPTPQNIGPNVLRDKPRRATKALRLGTKNVYKIDDYSKIQSTLYYQFTDDEFVFPIAAGIRDNLSNDGGLQLFYQFNKNQHLFTLGADLQIGKIKSKYFLNNSGNAAGLFSNNDLESSRFTFYANEVYAVLRELDLVGALQFSWDNRKIVENMDNPDLRPNIDFARFMQGGDLISVINSKAVEGKSNYFGFNPKLGLIYKPEKNMQVFANFSRSYEPPTFIELMMFNGGSPNSSPLNIEAANLKAQEASTIEIGYRGKTNRLDWNISLYNSWVKNELLTITDNGLFTGNTINSTAGTIHRGIEVGFNADIVTDVFATKDKFGFTANYTFSDFYFKEGDYKNNQIAGIPKHYLLTGIDYEHPFGIKVDFNIESLPEQTPIAHNNDLYQKPYTLLNSRIVFQKPTWSIFVEGRNLADKKYAASYLVIDRAVVPPLPGADKNSVTNFVPGIGRNIVVGANYTF